MTLVFQINYFSFVAAEKKKNSKVLCLHPDPTKTLGQSNYHDKVEILHSQVLKQSFIM